MGFCVETFEVSAQCAIPFFHFCWRTYSVQVLHSMLFTSNQVVQCMLFSYMQVFSSQLLTFCNTGGGALSSLFVCTYPKDRASKTCLWEELFQRKQKRTNGKYLANFTFCQIVILESIGVIFRNLQKTIAFLERSFMLSLAHFLLDHCEEEHSSLLVIGVLDYYYYFLNPF